MVWVNKITSIYIAIDACLNIPDIQIRIFITGPRANLCPQDFMFAILTQESVVCCFAYLASGYSFVRKTQDHFYLLNLWKLYNNQLCVSHASTDTRYRIVIYSDSKLNVMSYFDGYPPSSLGWQGNLQTRWMPAVSHVFSSHVSFCLIPLMQVSAISKFSSFWVSAIQDHSPVDQ